MRGLDRLRRIKHGILTSALLRRFAPYMADKYEMRTQIERYRELSHIGANSSNPWIRNSAKISGWLFPGEHEFLWELATRNKEGNILEVGTWMGKSASILAGACIEMSPESFVICIDSFEMDGTDWQIRFHRVLIGRQRTTFECFLENAKKFGFFTHVIPIVGTSEKILPILSASLRMIFLDGSHDFNHIKNEVALLLPQLRAGGVIALHDTSGDWPEVTKYVDDCLLVNPSFRLIGKKGSITAFEKI